MIRYIGAYVLLTLGIYWLASVIGETLDWRDEAPS